MEITSATPEQVAEFKMAAAQRYKELGVPPQVAEQLFERQMAKVAGELGLTEKKASVNMDRVNSLLAHLRTIKA